jgi:hypothetical protein
MDQETLGQQKRIPVHVDQDNHSLGEFPSLVWHSFEVHYLGFHTSYESSVTNKRSKMKCQYIIKVSQTDQSSPILNHENLYNDQKQHLQLEDSFRDTCNGQGLRVIQFLQSYHIKWVKVK